jgi:hypothetical protein
MESIIEIAPFVGAIGDMHSGSDIITTRLSGSLEPLTLPSMLAELRTLLHVHMPDPVWRCRSLQLVQSIEAKCFGYEAPLDRKYQLVIEDDDFGAHSPGEATTPEVSPKKPSVVPINLDARDTISDIIENLSLSMPPPPSLDEPTKERRQLRSKKTVKLKANLNATAVAEEEFEPINAENKVFNGSVTKNSNKVSRRRAPLAEISPSETNKQGLATQSSPCARPQEKITYYMTREVQSPSNCMTKAAAKSFIIPPLMPTQAFELNALPFSDIIHESGSGDNGIHIESACANIETGSYFCSKDAKDKPETTLNDAADEQETAIMGRMDQEGPVREEAVKSKRGGSHRRRIVSPKSSYEQDIQNLVKQQPSTSNISNEVMLSSDLASTLPHNGVQVSDAHEICSVPAEIEPLFSIDALEEEEEPPKRQSKRKVNTSKRRKSVAPLSFIHRVDDENIEESTNLSTSLSQAKRVLNKGMAFLSMDIEGDNEISSVLGGNSGPPESNAVESVDMSPEVSDIKLQFLSLEAPEQTEIIDFDEILLRQVWNTLTQSQIVSSEQLQSGYGIALWAAMSSIPQSEFHKETPNFIKSIATLFSQIDKYPIIGSICQPAIDSKGKKLISFASGAYFGECISPPNDRIAESVSSTDVICEKMADCVKYVQAFAKAFSLTLLSLIPTSCKAFISALSTLTRCHDKGQEVLRICQVIACTSPRQIFGAEVRQLSHAAHLLMVEINDRLCDHSCSAHVLRPILGQIGHYTIERVTKCEEKYETSWMATASIRSRLRWLVDEPPPCYTKTGIVSPVPLFEGCRSGLHEVITRNVKIKYPLHVGSAANSSTSQQKTLAMQQAIEGLPLSYLISVALRQVYDAFLVAYQYAEDTAREDRSESSASIHPRNLSMSPGSCGAVFTECDEIILPKPTNIAETSDEYGVRKLLSIYSRDILDQSSSIDIVSRQHAAQVSRTKK